MPIGDGPENQTTSQKWARPNLPSINPRTDEVVFQQIDVDHYTGHPMAGMPGAQVSQHFKKHCKYLQLMFLDCSGADL